jgi:hypothetical protein
MPDLTMRHNLHLISLTKLEFYLITKALVGSLSSKDNPNKKGFDGVYNEVKEAQRLGIDLLERRIKACEIEADLTEQAMENAIAAIAEAGGEE